MVGRSLAANQGEMVVSIDVRELTEACCTLTQVMKRRAGKDGSPSVGGKDIRIVEWGPMVYPESQMGSVN